MQLLIPDCDTNGKALKFYPQEQYRHKGNRKLHKFGAGAFCRFSVKADDVSGVYLLVDHGEVLYIGQTNNLYLRFNNHTYGSYGFITPSACYAGGQSTNCKINQLVLRYYEDGNTLQLYFLQTGKHKLIERELLGNIKTPYNNKDN